MRYRLLSVFIVAAAVMSVSLTAMANPFSEDTVIITIQDAPYSEEDVVININHPIPDEMMNTPGVNIPGHELEKGMASDTNPFKGEFDLILSGNTSIAKYKNGSVAVLYEDGTFEGTGYDGSRIRSNPRTGVFQKQLNDGTCITYNPDGEMTVREAEGNHITVDKDGNAVMVRKNGLVTEHDKSGAVSKMGLAGSGERISMRKNGDGTLTGGVIETGDGLRLEVQEDSSFTFTDSEQNVFHINDSDGHMEAGVSFPDGYGIRADSESLKIVSSSGDEYDYPFDENGVATIPLSSGGSVSYNRDDDGFSMLSDDFNCVMDENGNLVQADKDDVHIALRVNADGTIESGQYRKDENGDLIEINEDGTQVYVKDGGSLLIDINGGLSIDDFDWFSDEDDSGEDIELDDTGFEDKEEIVWDTVDWSSDIERLSIWLSLYEISAGSEFSMKESDLVQEVPSRSVHVTVSEEGEAKMVFPAFTYESPKKDDPNGEYERGSHAELTLKGQIVRTYRLREGNSVVYCQYGRITEKSHFTGEWEKYNYDYSLELHEGRLYKDEADVYEMNIAPYDKEAGTESEFWIYYFTDTDRYQVEILLDGKETGFYYYAGFTDGELDSSSDYYDNFADQVGGMYIDLFQGFSAEEWQNPHESTAEVDCDRWYGLTGE